DEPPLPVEPPDDVDPPEEDEPPLPESPPEPETVLALGAHPVWAKENSVARQVPTRISLGLVMGAPSKWRLGLDMVVDGKSYHFAGPPRQESSADARGPENYPGT